MKLYLRIMILLVIKFRISKASNRWLIKLFWSNYFTEPGTAKILQQNVFVYSIHSIFISISLISVKYQLTWGKYFTLGKYVRFVNTLITLHKQNFVNVLGKSGQNMPQIIAQQYKFMDLLDKLSEVVF